MEYTTFIIFATLMGYIHGKTGFLHFELESYRVWVWNVQYGEMTELW